MKVYCLFERDYSSDGHTIVELEAIYLTKESAEAWKESYHRINCFYRLEYFIEEWEVS